MAIAARISLLLSTLLTAFYAVDAYGAGGADFGGLVDIGGSLGDVSEM
jgi:hypothetical protein